MPIAYQRNINTKRTIAMAAPRRTAHTWLPPAAELIKTCDGAGVPVGPPGRAGVVGQYPVAGVVNGTAAICNGTVSVTWLVPFAPHALHEASVVVSGTQTAAGALSPQYLLHSGTRIVVWYSTGIRDARPVASTVVYVMVVTSVDVEGGCGSGSPSGGGGGDTSSDVRP
ncbi:uncharacterized protein GLRG_02800 [Colletotrichum graminicola M1.001]|uniref:Uncharacterized protein n=1 Tax=Colletotrichum graminicola (strain M1.001 / M2 / FGSC 10212) TaxID=645133 RepID=E3Q9W8_COLGM|nr:uncharacterized protein GLRG_02800 [Colletotrichum graminicola M1.001]EFQ27656.1 hypothetical protein GLRG_02800 [Colletotrichum graminicola M1.001]